MRKKILQDKDFLQGLKSYIEENYEPPVIAASSVQSPIFAESRSFVPKSNRPMDFGMCEALEALDCLAPAEKFEEFGEFEDLDDLDDLLRNFDELQDRASKTFQEMLFIYIVEKDMKPSEVYKAANMTKQTFSKIKSNKSYHPNKATAFALAIALQLNLDEAIDFIGRASYTFSPSSKQDIIVQYFIKKGRYDIAEVDAVLEDYGERTLTEYI